MEDAPTSIALGFIGNTQAWYYLVSNLNITSEKSLYSNVINTIFRCSKECIVPLSFHSFMRYTSFCVFMLSYLKYSILLFGGVLMSCFMCTKATSHTHTLEYSYFSFKFTFPNCYTILTCTSYSASVMSTPCACSYIRVWKGVRKVWSTYWCIITKLRGD